VVEYVEIVAGCPPSSTKALLLSREQNYLQWLFTQPEHLRYNFLPTAGSSLGYQHAEEAKAKMSGRVLSDCTKAAISAAKVGENNPMYGKTGSNHPMYGSVSATALGVSVYNLDNQLVQSFSSRAAAATWLGVSRDTVLRYIRSKQLFRGKYMIKTNCKDS
jgi:group I intron endonuclease